VKPSVYLETTIISYLAARPSRDVITAAYQKITVEWWATRDAFRLFVSERVIHEANAGNATMAAKRLQFVEGIASLSMTDETTSFAKLILQSTSLPAKAAEDALHIALASVHEIDFLLTWNCKHIANAVLIRKVAELCDQCGYKWPVICTPPELLAKS